MKSVSFYIKHINRTQVISAVILVALLATGWFFFFRGAAGTDGFLTLEYKPFIQQVSVSGKVVAAKEVDLGFSQSGRITGVYVSVGNFVSQGTTLAVVENGDQRAALLQREAALENQQAKLAALKAGTRQEEIAVAQSSVERDTQALIDALQDAYRAADGAVHNTLDQFISNPRTNPALSFSVSDSNIKTSVESKRLAAEATLSAWSGGVFALSAGSDLPQAASAAQSNISSVVSLLSDANTAINRAISSTQVPQATLDDYSAAVATARTNVNVSIASVSSAKSALDASRKNLALKVAGSTQEDISAQEAQTAGAAADVAAAAAQLQKTFISAPFSGIITTVDAKAGKIVSPNTPEISMISTGAFQIESYVPEINIALVAVGDKASVTLDAYGDKKFSASVVSVDPAETVRDGVSTYRAMLQFDAQDPLIKSGMTANVAIVTDVKESVLSVPQGLVVYRDGKTFVRVLAGKSTVEREVTLGGVSSLGEAEVLSGLNQGDTIITTLP